MLVNWSQCNWWLLIACWSQMADVGDPIRVSSVVLLESCVCQAVQKRIGLGKKERMQTALKAAECWDPSHVETHIRNRDFSHLLPLSATPCLWEDPEVVNPLLTQWLEPLRACFELRVRLLLRDRKRLFSPGWESQPVSTWWQVYISTVFTGAFLMAHANCSFSPL